MTQILFLGQLLIWLIGVLWTLGWLFFAVVIFLLCKSEYACRKWPQVKGIIVGASQDKDDEEPGDIVEIKFAYQIENSDYESRDVRKISSRHNQSKVEDFLKQYPTGKEIEVYYDPLNPTITRLEPVKSFWVFGPGLIYFGVCLAIGFFILIKWWPFN